MNRAAVLLFGLAALLAPAGIRAQAINAGFGGNVSSLVNVPFDVPLLVDMTARPERLGAFAARIQWNPAVLQYQVGVNGSFGSITTNTDSAAQGVIRLTGANPAGVTGLVTLGIVRFLPLTADAVTLALSLPELYAAGTFADLRPSVTVTNGQFCPALGRLGDIDGDSQVNSRDALIALMAAVGLDVSPYTIALGDVDGNGVTDTRDALIILSNAVGIDVSAFRVGAILGGACAGFVPVTMSITPSVAADVLPGQRVSFEVRAAGPTGALVIIPNPVLKSSDNTILTFQGGSNPATAVALAAGTATVTAIRDGRDSVKATVTVVSRRFRHVVDAKAATATNQLGTAPFPFATIAQGIGFARDSDTVEVRVGRYPESVQLDRAAVLMGDTLADGTRPLIALDSAASYAGLLLLGPGARLAEYLSIDGYHDGVDIFGPSDVVLRGLRATNATYGVVVDSTMGTLRVESSRLTGNGLETYGYGVEANAAVDTLVVQGSDISDFGSDGIYTIAADSIAVLQSAIHDVGDYGIEVRQSSECGDCAPPARRSGAAVLAQPATAVTVDSSTIVRAGYRIAYLDVVRSAVFSHSKLGGSEYGIEVYGNYSGRVRFLADSVAAYGGPSYYDWVDAYELDSLAVDSVFVQAASAYTADVSLVRVTNSQFVNIQNRALAAEGGGTVVLDNLSVIGDPGCDLCGYAFEIYGPRITANRITGVNLYYGFEVEGDSSLTLTNSTLRHVEYPVEWYGSSTDSTSRLAVNHTTFSGFYEAIRAYDGGLTVDSSTFQNGEEYGIYFEGSGPVRVTQNGFASIPNAVELHPYSTYGGWVDTLAGNTVTDLSGEGIYVDGDDSVKVRMLGNSVTCNATGRTDGYGLDLEYASGVAAGNQVSGCYQGIYVYDNNGPSVRADSVRVNNLMLPSSAYQAEGIYVEGSIKANIANNVLTADTSGYLYDGVIAMRGYQPGATATIDSNTVTGGSAAGIYVAYLDSALVRWNTVRGVNAPSSSYGGIVMEGRLTFLAQVYGNQVRGMFGNGIRIYNSDTAMVQVDSNLVDSSSANGIELDGGADSVTNNRISHSLAAGVYVGPAVNIGRSRVTANNIEGNAFGLQANGYAYSALNNWWGSANGPQLFDSSATGGDSVSVGLLYNPWAEIEFSTLPLPAVAARPSLALRSISSVRTIKAPAPTGLDAPVAKKALVARAASPARSPRALTTAARVPAGLKPAQALVWQRAVALRASAATVATQRAQARAARVQARTLAHQIRVQRIQQRQAQLETRRQAKQARQAARASTAHRVVPQ